MSSKKTHVMLLTKYCDSAASTSPETLLTDKAVTLSEFVENRLYFTTVPSNIVPKNDASFHFFTTDREYLYKNFHSDFGPLNLGCLYHYCTKLNSRLEFVDKDVKVVHYTNPDYKKRSNAAFLISAFAVLYLGMTPDDAFERLTVSGDSFRPFQDASLVVDVYTISILDCLKGLRKAYDCGFFNFDDFNLHEYEKGKKFRNGDFNWIVPGKLLAFMGPVSHQSSVHKHSPSFYLDYFKENHVNTVVRLNEKYYDAQDFIKAGIKHYDLYFQDGGIPSRSIANEFLKICECADGAIAVHCKAGLGRTGCLIGSYLIKHYDMSAKEAIAWMRICRPGCVIGRQQSWLECVERTCRLKKELYDIDNNSPRDPVTHDYGIYSIRAKTTKSLCCGEHNSCGKGNTRVKYTTTIGDGSAKSEKHVDKQKKEEKNKTLKKLLDSKNGNEEVRPVLTSGKGISSQQPKKDEKKLMAEGDQVNTYQSFRQFLAKNATR